MIVFIENCISSEIKIVLAKMKYEHFKNKIYFNQKNLQAFNIYIDK